MYLTKLEYFVDAGMVDDSFVKMVCRILANAWNEAGSTQIRMEDERVENFYMIANNIFDIQQLIFSHAHPVQPAFWRTPNR